MNPMVGKAALAVGGAGLAYVGYQTFVKKTPVLQSLRGKTANDTPVQVVVPVVPDTPKLGQSVTPPLPGSTATPPPAPLSSLPVIGNLMIGANVLNPSKPAIISPGGGSNFQVSTNQDIQRALNTLGYAQPPLVVDGNIGPLSTTAIKAFQAAKNLTVDGVAGPTTKLALEVSLVAMTASGSTIGSNPIVTNATSAPPEISTTKQVQHALNLLGASPQLVEDGVMGPKTVAAVKAFQLAHGLTVDGVPGPKTDSALSLAIQQSGVQFSGESQHDFQKWNHGEFSEISTAEKKKSHASGKFG